MSQVGNRERCSVLEDFSDAHFLGSVEIGNLLGTF